MQEIQKIWNTTLYLRLSREDGDGEESNSITGQRELLRKYLSGHPELREYAVKIDDGWSGSNFDRPAFQEMMDDVRAGRTDCIIVKDLSRFGRNYLEAGEYIEKLFPFLGVRLIAVNDNFDSMQEKSYSDDLIVPFKNLINESYCRDISVKIRSQMDAKRQNGQYLGSFAAYGYLKDPEDKHRLIVDEYAAEIVREIFHWKLSGVNPQDIADRLNSAGILSPLEYKHSLGMQCSTPFQVYSQATWSSGSVIRVLKNPLYIGTLVQGKNTTPSYKIHKQIQKPEEEWAVIEHCHEGIISKDEFDTVQKIMKLDTRRSPNADQVSLFSGMLFCGDCGASMVRKLTTSGGKQYLYYICSANKHEKTCSPHRIRGEVLEEIVLDDLQHHINAIADMEELFREADAAPLRTAEALKVKRQLEERQKEYERAQHLMMSLYENLTDGVITREEYRQFKQQYSDRAADLKKQMDSLQERLTTMQDHMTDTGWIEQFKQYRNLTELDREVVVTLIDHILIHEDKTVEIVYRWQDEYAWQMDILKQAQLPEVV